MAPRRGESKIIDIHGRIRCMKMTPRRGESTIQRMHANWDQNCPQKARTKVRYTLYLQHGVTISTTRNIFAVRRQGAYGCNVIVTLTTHVVKGTSWVKGRIQDSNRENICVHDGITKEMCKQDKAAKGTTISRQQMSPTRISRDTK